MDNLVSDFVCEAADSLGGLQSGLARLAVDRSDRAALVEIQRRLHGLKGGCGFVGFNRAEALAHAGESLLAAVSNSPGPVSAAAIAPLGAMIERLGELFALAAETVGEPAGDDGALVALIEEAAVGLRGVRADFQPSEIKPAGLNAAAIVSERRVHAPWSGLDALARSLGDRLGKRIELMTGGDDLRIDPAAIPALRTALIALVRNACDHGVESPAERRAAGKPSRAILRLSVHLRGDGCAIELADDGRGIDPELIRQHCIAQGRIDAATAARLDEGELQAMVFAPGVTTAHTVTALSGRGLGLELVRREIEALGGAVELTSSPGCGARFLMRLPASVLATAAARGRVAA
jgi:two-component system chemotaxis sensor kinase CheA